MKRFLILIVVVMFGAAFTTPAMAEWPAPAFPMKCDSLGTMQMSAVGSAAYAATKLDTLTTWLNSANGHIAGDPMTTTYKAEGGGVYTSMYIEAHMYDSCATTDSNRYYVVVDQAMGGGTAAALDTSTIYWAVVDSILFNGAVPTGKKVTLNGMPLIRFRNQYAAATDQTDTMTNYVKVIFIK